MKIQIRSALACESDRDGHDGTDGTFWYPDESLTRPWRGSESLPWHCVSPFDSIMISRPKISTLGVVMAIMVPASSLDSDKPWAYF